MAPGAQVQTFAYALPKTVSNPVLAIELGDGGLACSLPVFSWSRLRSWSSWCTCTPRQEAGAGSRAGSRAGLTGRRRPRSGRGTRGRPDARRRGQPTWMNRIDATGACGSHPVAQGLRRSRGNQRPVASAPPTASRSDRSRDLAGRRDGSRRLAAVGSRARGLSRVRSARRRGEARHRNEASATGKT